jgi:hypothetical protein
LFGKKEDQDKKYVFTKEDDIQTFERCVGLQQANSAMNSKDRLELNFMKIIVKQNEEIIEELKKLNSK